MTFGSADMGGISETPSLDEAWAWLARHSNWLSRLPTDKRDSLRTVAQLRDYQPGDPVFRAGELPNGVFGLCRGALNLAVPRMDGEEFFFHRVESGFWIGDLALFSRQRRLVTVRAASACTLVYLPQNQLDALVAANPGIIDEFYQLSYQNMRIVLGLLGNLSISRAENRVALRLLAQTDQQQDSRDWIRLSQDSLSEMVSLSPQSVRRSLHKLEAEGLIEAGYGRIRILDPERLAILCGYAGTAPL